ncbi:MAG: accessory factor UbiK family protein [Sphingomonadaceae bacterium]
MQNQNPIMEDFTRLMSSIAGTMAGAGREAEAKIREKIRETVGGLDMVSREEFEAVKTLASEARAEIEVLKSEIAALRGDKPAAGDENSPTI